MNLFGPPAAPPGPAGEGQPPTGWNPRTVHLVVSQTTFIHLALILVTLWLLVRLWPVLLVLVVALFILGTLSPTVLWMERWQIRRSFGIALVFTGVLTLAILTLAVAVPSVVAQAAALVEREPAFRMGLADYLAHYHLTAPFADWLRNLRYGAPGNNVGATAFAFSLRIFQVAAFGLSALFLALYMMIDRDRLRGGLFAIIPRTHHLRLTRVILNLETIVGAYIRGQLITCLLIGAFTFVLLTACGVENAMALAVFAAVADILPYIGAVLSIAPAGLAALGHSPTTGAIVVVAMLAYQEFESRVLVPKIYGQALRLPSSVVFFSLLAGWTLMGLLGALLALPVAATVMMLIEELRVDLPGEPEQAADTLLRARDAVQEAEYERRTEGVAAEQAAAIAVEISVDRRNHDQHPESSS